MNTTLDVRPNDPRYISAVLADYGRAIPSESVKPLSAYERSILTELLARTAGRELISNV